MPNVSVEQNEQNNATAEIEEDKKERIKREKEEEKARIKKENYENALRCSIKFLMRNKERILDNEFLTTLETEFQVDDGIKNEENPLMKMLLLVDKIVKIDKVEDFVETLKKSDDEKRKKCGEYIDSQEKQIAYKAEFKDNKNLDYEFPNGTDKSFILVIANNDWDLTFLKDFCKTRSIRFNESKNEKLILDEKSGLGNYLEQYFIDRKMNCEFLGVIVCGIEKELEKNDDGNMIIINTKSKDGKDIKLQFTKKALLHAAFPENLKKIPKFVMFISEKEAITEKDDVSETEILWKEETKLPYSGFTNSFIVDLKYPNGKSKGKDYLEKWIETLEKYEEIDFVQSICYANHLMADGEKKGESPFSQGTNEMETDANEEIASIRFHSDRNLVFKKSEADKKPEEKTENKPDGQAEEHQAESETP